MECYRRTGQQFTAWLAEKGLPGDTEAIDAPHIRAFLTAKTGRASAAWPRTARGAVSECGRSPWHPVSLPWAGLLRIAANLARDRWRAGPARVVPVGDIPERPAPGPGPDGLAVESDRRAALLSALDRLRPDQRAVLKLRILEGRTASEVAALTNRSAAAVRQLQVRALAALRAALDDQPGEMIADFGRD